jgi:hypothetical protein
LNGGGGGRKEKFKKDVVHEETHIYLVYLFDSDIHSADESPRPNHFIFIF